MFYPPPAPPLAGLVCRLWLQQTEYTQERGEFQGLDSGPASPPQVENLLPWPTLEGTDLDLLEESADFLNIT